MGSQMWVLSKILRKTTEMKSALLSVTQNLRVL